MHISCIGRDQQAFFGKQDITIFRQDIGKVDFKIAGNGMRYTHGNGNFLVILFGKRDRYEMIA